MIINYYILDSIKPEGYDYWEGKLNGKEIEVFAPEPGQLDPENEAFLVAEGFAKCDAPGSGTFLIEETAWEYLNS